jgi:hypothetical protein
VRLTVVSKDSAAHTVTVKPATLHVRAHGRASTVLENLPVGGHLVELDGHQRAALVIGVAPGP